MTTDSLIAPPPASTAEEAPSFNLRELLEEVVRKRASDLHITVGERPKLRVDGSLVNSDNPGVLGPKETLLLAYSILTEKQKKRFETEDELDFAFGIQNLARFRANVYKQRGCVALAIRLIPFKILTFEELGLPRSVAVFAERPNGLVLVTGPTGSGKTTTLAAVLDKINRERRSHILTVEDPIEFVHRHQGCMINQREVGSDTRSFAAALKYALRQDPDIILVGEMRDLETVQAAVTIAETGHLVFATLHTNSAAETINRIIDVFPQGQQPQIRAQLAFVLEGIVTQTLIPRMRGKGRVMAAEVLVITNAIRSLIRDDKVHQIYSLMQAGQRHGMQTMNQSLFAHFVNREISEEDAIRRSNDPDDLYRMMGKPVPKP